MKFICQVQVVGARGLIGEEGDDDDSSSPFSFLNPWGGSSIDPFARIKMGRVDDLHAPLSVDTDSRTYASNNTFHIEYDKQMDLDVELWHKMRSIELNLSRLSKNVCLGHVTVPISEMFDGRNLLELDEWFSIEVPEEGTKDEVINMWGDSNAAEVDGLQHTYLLQDDDEDDEYVGDNVVGEGDGADAAVEFDADDPLRSSPLASLSREHRQMLQDEADAEWEGAEGSQHHKSTWLGLRKLFVTRPPSEDDDVGLEMAASAEKLAAKTQVRLKISIVREVWALLWLLLFSQFHHRQPIQCMVFCVLPVICAIQPRPMSVPIF